jgi:hypothetical protein
MLPRGYCARGNSRACCGIEAIAVQSYRIHGDSQPKEAPMAGYRVKMLFYKKYLSDKILPRKVPLLECAGKMLVFRYDYMEKNYRSGNELLA